MTRVVLLTRHGCSIQMTVRASGSCAAVSPGKAGEIGAVSPWESQRDLTGRASVAYGAQQMVQHSLQVCLLGTFSACNETRN